MIHYIVNNKEVNLPADLSTEFYSKNPLLTKEGEYTLDIDIDLRDPQNAYVYEHCHRIDQHSMPSGRHATLYDECGVIIDGTEVILEVNDEKVKVQVTGGVSDLNYDLNQGQTLHELTVSLDYFIDVQEYRDVATRIIDGDYTDCHGVLVPAVTGTDVLMGESSYCVPTVNHGTAPEPVSHDFGGDRPYVVQRLEGLCVFPWLWYAVEAVIDGLGFNIGYNYIKEDPVLQRLLVVQRNALKTGCGVLSLLPDWEVGTFITEVEKLCNVVFTVNKQENSVSVLSIEDYYADDAHSIVIGRDDLVGELGKKIDTDSNGSTDIVTLYDEVRYKLPSYPQYKYLCVDDDVMDIADKENCEELTTDADCRAHVHNVWRAIKGNWDFETDRKSAEAEKEYRRGNHLFYDPALDMMFVLKYQEEDEVKIYSNPILPYQEKELLYTVRYAPTFYVQHLNTYQPVVNKLGGNSVELRIVPCEMAWRRISWTEGGTTKTDFRPIPCVRNKTDVAAAEFYIEGEDEPDGENIINDEIINGVSKASVPDNIFVAFYFGKYGDSEVQRYPIVSPTNRLVKYINMENVPDSQTAEVVTIDSRERGMTMELAGEYGMYATNYAKNEKFDVSQEYTIRFKTVGRPDPKSVFIIDHVKFFCKQLKYTVKDGRVSEVAEGIFYPAKD